MNRPRTICLLIALAAIASCKGRDPVGPGPSPVAFSIARTSGDAQTGIAGTTLPSRLTVRVLDAAGKPVSNARVTWNAGSNSGTVSPGVSFTNSDGETSTRWTLGTIAGAARVTAQVGGVNPVTFSATVLPGSVAQIVSLPDILILGVGDTIRIRSVVRDSYGNDINGQAVTYASSNTAIVTVALGGRITAVGEGTSFIIATAEAFADSIPVTVTEAGSSPCGATALKDLAIGEVYYPAGGTRSTRICLGAPAGRSADYGIVAASAAPSFATTISADIYGLGIDGPIAQNAYVGAHAGVSGDPFAGGPYTSGPNGTGSSGQVFPSTGRGTVSQSGARLPQLSLDLEQVDRRAEYELRLRERRELAGLVEGARARYAESRAAREYAEPREVRIGETMQLNTNPYSACESPDMRVGRVAAIGTKSIVVADTGNPFGGYTDVEYQQIAATFDTLIYPIVVEAFGSPTDVSGYGKIILFYTRAVNALTPTRAPYIIGGFFFARDLYPKSSSGGVAGCSASNHAEMFYLLVPDPGGSINSNPRSKDAVSRLNLGTVAHEFEHLINSSRRLYINSGAVPAEETWLDEGLAHIAEELLYLRLAGYTTRQNLDLQHVAGNPARSTDFSNFGIQNFGRFYEYLRNPEINSPYAPNDSLATRGATWSFLRYAASRQGPGGEFGFLHSLVNSRTAGHANLAAAIPSLSEYIRDWSISNMADDYSAEVMSRLTSEYVNPTWNFRSIFPSLRIGGQALRTYPLGSRLLFHNVPQRIVLPGGATSYIRFTVPAGRQGVVSLSSNGAALPAEVMLGVVRLQ